MVPNPIRILIGDDHPIVREGLVAVLRADGDLEVVAEASNGHEAVEAARRTRPDVVLLDLQMPGLTGLEAATAILAELPGVKVMILTTFADEKSVLECLKAGVHGFVVKDVAKLELKQHIRAVLRGEAVVDPKVAGVLMARVRGSLTPAAQRADVELTPQQLSVLRLIAQGHSNREIGDRLGLTENTVKGHVAEILHRMGVKSRVEAALQASSRGWI